MECGENCSSRETLRRFAAGGLTVDERLAVVTQLRQCDSCRAYVDSLLDMTLERMEQTGQLPADAADSGEEVAPLTADSLASADALTVNGALENDDIFEPTSDARFIGRIGAYDVISVLGRGGMGLVFLGFDTRLQRLVAIKVLQKSIAAREDSRKQFLREARAAAAINHPNVVTIHDVNSNDEDSPFLVMEYIPDGTLRQRLARGGGLPVREAMLIGEQVARGLAAAHRLGVVHRDIKPGNVMLKGDAQLAKITDFGLACNEEERRADGRAVGTAAYMSPEQARGRPLTTQSDIFSFGCLLYAMLNGKSPFHSDSALDSAQRVVGYTPEAPVLEAAAPSELKELILECLAKAPDERPMSMDVVADRLLDMIRGDSPRPAAAARRAKFDQPRAAYTSFATFVATALLVIMVGAVWRFRQSAEAANSEEAIQFGEPKSMRVGPEANYSTLAEALADATPYSIITVADGSELSESVTISGPRFTGLQLRLSGVVIEPEDETAIVIRNVQDLKIEGGDFQIPGDRYGIRVNGNASGLVIDGMKLEQLGSEKAAILLHGGAHGAANRPMQFRNMDIRCHKIGLICHSAEGGKVEHVVMENCRLQGVTPDAGVLVIMDGPVENFTARNNVFYLASRGISLDVLEPNMLTNVAFTNNTAFELDMFMTPLESDPNQSFVIDRTLILACNKVDRAPILQRFAGWFRENLWENRPSGEFAVVADDISSVDLHSRDPDANDFLRPKDDRLTTESGPIGAKHETAK